ncbi:hypothetical protein VOLCADRAFT_103032 [Volvox carteri f. nagariensis]|uniref:Uncharacterized protein n=1 Tax=Volvox carteri f. nagariensis TaxID=3068 RepID=D8TJH4_VOLCA|nr:uncharacterized protein VOLCADRAFT_103032 [Volvox carteri f. nagariensis]EFJ52374.1 hypothetical protein VOLCADRAFT_103032 [Volvox carteri f. nagariensis]|eukprot:XP_002946447.1 hypothetical protein VOLCADRAFT_103032 [Volvox carteri f. nagariensis]
MTTESRMKQKQVHQDANCTRLHGWRQAPEDGPSTSDSHHDSWPTPWTRRHVAIGAAVALGAMAGSDPVQAAKTVVLRDGTEVQAFEHGMTLAIVALRGSIPAQWTLDFQTAIGKYCGFSLDQRMQLADIFKELSDTSGENKRSAGLADVITLGDIWMGAAIQRGLLQPIPGATSSRWYRMLPQRLRQLGHRNAAGMPDPTGEVYAYRRDRLLRRGGRPILDWCDLLQPALAGRVAMLDSPRELLAAAVRSLAAENAGLGDGGGRGVDGGKSGRAWVSVNASARELAAAGISEEVLQGRVAAFRRQVRLFSSQDHVRALQAGDVWAVVGYSQELVQLAERSGSSIELLAPLSGTQLWADVWAVPAGARGGHRHSGPSPLLPVWIEFTLSPGRITGQPSLKGGAPAALLPATPEPTDPAATRLLAAIHEHRRHLLEARAAAESQGPLAAARRVSLLKPFLSDPWVSHASGAGLNGAGSGGKRHDVAGEESHGAAMGTVAAATPTRGSVFPSVELHHANGYLPAAPLLARSEFLLPLPDEATAEMYRRVLGDMTKTTPAGASAS